MSAQVAAALRAALEGWTEEQWTKGEYARDKYGGSVSASNPNATCWCSIGRVLLKIQDSDSAIGFLRKAVHERAWEAVISWNDAPTRTFSEVRALWLRAAELAEKKGAGR